MKLNTSAAKQEYEEQVIQERREGGLAVLPRQGRLPQAWATT